MYFLQKKVENIWEAGQNQQPVQKLSYAVFTIFR